MIEIRHILDYRDRHPTESAAHIMMLDDDMVAVSPTTVYRILKATGRLDRWNAKTSKKGTGFVQPLGPHKHWHVDISYLNLGGTYYYLCSLLGGYSRSIIHWEVRESMTKQDVQTISSGLWKITPASRRGLLATMAPSRGTQYSGSAKEFKTFIRTCGCRSSTIQLSFPSSASKLPSLKSSSGCAKHSPPHEIVLNWRTTCSSSEISSLSLHGSS